MQMRSTRINQRYLPGIELQRELQVTSDLGKACDFAADSLWVIGTALAGLETTVHAALSSGAARPRAIVWLCKGVKTAPGSLPMLPATLLQATLANLAQARPASSHEPLSSPPLALGSLSGPSFASEVGQGQPTALVAASDHPECSQLMIEAFHHHQMRVYASSDVVGVSIGGALKNVVAIAAGISDGLGLGNNARAALITRGLAEIARLGEAMGARQETFMGLAGLGDLVLTCTGNASRNRQVGLSLAQGKQLSDIVAALGHVAEGVSTTHAAVALARAKGVELPIAEAVQKVLQGTISAQQAVRGLLSREAKREDDGGPDQFEGIV
jgi:glycerol-3-phosphate dehydrogenase (NAD(P)+)